MAVRGATELREYGRRRDFSRTPEPAGQARRPKRRGKPRFVIQKHHASHLHYDFRLEAGGVLKSWAVPKGPSLDPKERRLARHVEDHPLEYRDFEGVIPEGNYGAGEVIVWDRGTYDVVGEDEGDAGRSIDRGKIKFVLHGKKLHGGFTLVRMHGRGRDDRSWLLIKDRDDAVDTAWRATEHDKSVKTQHTLEDVAANPRARRWISNRASNGAASAPGYSDFMLATLVREPFDSEDWLFEIKWDGIRALCAIERNGSMQLVSRRGKDQLLKFPELSSVARAFQPLPIVVDGEIVSLDSGGKSSFERLQSPANRGSARVSFVVFDLLYYDGRDVRGEPLETRKELLERARKPGSPGVLLSKHVVGDGRALFSLAEREGLEGIIAKRRDSIYGTGRSKDWLKIKAEMRQECVICGYTEPRGSRQAFGSLVLGLYQGDRLEYVGQVGTGFTGATLKTLYEKLSRIETRDSPFSPVPRLLGRAHWVTPKYVAEIRFAEWTRGSKLRQPSFLGLRDDKTPRECVREVS